MKQYNILKILSAILYDDALTNFANYARAHLSMGVNVFADARESKCFTYSNNDNEITIVLGLLFYQKAYKIPKEVSQEMFQQIWNHASNVYKGLAFHEYWHGKYTPMKFLNRTLNSMTSSLADFCQPIVNCVEDSCIETKGTYDEPSLKDPIETMNEFLSYQETIDALDEQIKNNPKNPLTMQNFLLNKVFGKDYLLTEKYSLYEDNKDFFDDCIYLIKYSPDNITRAKREIAFAIEIAKLLDGEKPDKNNVDGPGQVPTNRQGPSSQNGGTPGNQSILQQVIDTYNQVSNIQGGWQPRLKDGDDELDLKPPTSSMQAQNTISDSDVSSLFDSDLAQEQVTMLANDEPVLNARHKVVHLNNYTDTSGYLSHYTKVVNAMSDVINSTVSVIRRMKSENTTEWKTAQRSGKFHVRSYVDSDLREEGKVFKKAIAPKKEADIVGLMLLDISGSTRGSKSYMIGASAITLAEAFNRLRYPFAIYSFTEGSECYTIKLKDFKDSFIKTKTNLTIHTEQYSVDNLPLFCCNVDEVTLRYARKVLKKQPQKDKLCIVISDGATCGSSSDLKKIAASMEKEGITVLAIGVYDDNVKDIYKNYVLVKNEADLKKLPKFLSDYLISKVFKEV